MRKHLHDPPATSRETGNFYVLQYDSASAGAIPGLGVRHLP